MTVMPILSSLDNCHLTPSDPHKCCCRKAQSWLNALTTHPTLYISPLPPTSFTSKRCCCHLQGPSWPVPSQEVEYYLCGACDNSLHGPLSFITLSSNEPNSEAVGVLSILLANITSVDPPVYLSVPICCFCPYT